MKQELQIKVIRSRRRTMALQLKAEGLIVRVPYGIPNSQVLAFVEKNRDWIEKHLAELRSREEQGKTVSRLTMDEIRDLAAQARQYIPERVRYYASVIGVDYGRITIRNQRSRWGSCSQKGNLNFNCLLMLAPPEVIDSVVVHELCHRREMNHSSRFYELVYKAMPDYDRWNRWLKENGGALMQRMTG